MKFQSDLIQIKDPVKAIKQYFPTVLFKMYKVVLTVWV